MKRKDESNVPTDEDDEGRIRRQGRKKTAVDHWGPREAFGQHMYSLQITVGSLVRPVFYLLARSLRRADAGKQV